MYLARIDMELSAPRVRAALVDSQKMHRLLTGLYQNSRHDVSLLYRVKPNGRVVSVYQYANSPIKKENISSGMSLVGERCLDEWLDSMQAGQTWRFDLVTMPFKKERRDDSGNSRRRMIRDEEERLEWLFRKAEQNGFSILEVQEFKDEKMNIYHPSDKGGKMVMDSYRYTGSMTIKDASAFRKAVQEGIGPGKAYGLGMLLLKR
ncbi:MAG: type I-E CRISPR-associated protein Cas6/Cse3/CasE [Lachnospiraceae bacterium]|nr:type I-E CRISPR-associated protein Cas6/Cse3/CasE [Lachnospiraceae bacterium]